MTGDTCHPDDQGLYLDNVAQQVRRIRSHPALALWCCSNESTEVNGIEPLVKRLTGTTSWMMMSECDGVHDGCPYWPTNPMRYYDDTAAEERGSRVWGFSPEYGTCALPAADQCRKFMSEASLWPVEKNVANWNYREGGGFDRMTAIHHRAVLQYGMPKTFDDYARQSQAVDALSHRALWEVWNLARNTATGVLFWYNNTPIPQLGSHAWDYDLDQSAAFFAQKNALEPLHAQYEYLSNRVCVVSDVYGTHDLTVRAEVYDFESRKVWGNQMKVRVEGEGCTEAFAIPFSTAAVLCLDRPHFVKLRLFEQGQEIASSFYWRSSSRYAGPESETGPCFAGFQELSHLPRTTLRTSLSPSVGGRRTCVVTNCGDKLAFLVNVQAYGKDGRRLVPVHYLDNFFSLLPGESRTVEIDFETGFDKCKAVAWNSEL